VKCEKKNIKTKNLKLRQKEATLLKMTKCILMIVELTGFFIKIQGRLHNFYIFSPSLIWLFLILYRQKVLGSIHRLPKMEPVSGKSARMIDTLDCFQPIKSHNFHHAQKLK